MTDPMTRRQFLRLLAVGSGSTLVAACSQPAAPAPTAAPKAETKPAPAAPAPAAKPAESPAAAPAAKPAPQASPAAQPAAKAAALGPARKTPLIDQLYEDAKKEGKVVYWDIFEKEEAQKFVDAFKADYPGIELEILLITADEQNVRGVAEARAGQVTFDVIVASEQVFPDFKKNGLVSDNTELLELAGIPRELQYEGTYAPEWTVYGSAYNPNLVKESELPTDWEGFLDPKWKGKLAVESRMITFVYATPFMGGEAKVIEYLQKLKANEPRFNRGDIATNKLLVAGEFPVLLGAYLQNYWRYVPEKAPWGLVPFKEIYTGTPGPGYTTPQKPPHPNAAKLFLYWAAGPAGRALHADRNTSNPHPGNEGRPSKLLQELGITVKQAPREYSDRLSELQKKYQEAIGLPVS